MIVEVLQGQNCYWSIEYAFGKFNSKCIYTLYCRYFDALSLKLESVAPATLEYEKLSTALCASQLQLAKLCTRNMRCFTQQAVRAREDPASLVTTTSTSSDRKLLPKFQTFYIVFVGTVQVGSWPDQRKLFVIVRHTRWSVSLTLR